MCSTPPGDADRGNNSQFTLGRVDGGLERCAQAAAISGNGRGKGARAKMDHVAAKGSVTRTEKGRKGRSAAIQGAGEEICDVEAEGHAGFGEDMEDSSNRGGKKVV